MLTSVPSVLISGAGPTGLTLAALLARAGVSCRIVDALGAPRPWARASTMLAGVLELLQAMGVADREGPFATLSFANVDSPFGCNLLIGEQDTERGRRASRRKIAGRRAGAWGAC